LVGSSNSALFVLLHITTKVEIQMWIDTVLFVITFIVSAALAVIGIMVAYQLYHTHQKPVLQILLYQQIFLISFFIYGIWGNIALHKILADLNLSEELETKIAIFIPVLGIPFLIVSWFMLLRFSLSLNGFKDSKRFPWNYFPSLFIVVFVFSILINNGIIGVSSNPDLFIVRSIAAINLVVHIFFLAPFILGKKKKLLSKELVLKKTHAFFYFIGVVIYSVILYFFDIFGSVSECVSILILFGVSISIPITIKLNEKTQILPQTSTNINFSEFCNHYEISKREAEIVLEICTGKTNKAISEKLFITLQTVKDHNYRIYSKLGVKTRVQLTNLVREKTGSAL
jgi:DNA-binding CsgD family transcriptional regulator